MGTVNAHPKEEERREKKEQGIHPGEWLYGRRVTQSCRKYH
jgi:hypothetical protein